MMLRILTMQGQVRPAFPIRAHRRGETDEQAERQPTGDRLARRFPEFRGEELPPSEPVPSAAFEMVRRELSRNHS